MSDRMKGPDGPEEKVAATRSGSLHYLDWGGRHSRAMILLHGIGDNAHIWDDFSRHACRRLRILAVDQRGHGKSDPSLPPAYRCEDYVADLEDFIETLGCDQVILMGHSMGALHATCYAAMTEERVAALVHVDIEPCPPEWNRKYLLNLYRDLPEFYDTVEVYIDHKRQDSPYADAAFLRRYAAFSLCEEDGRYRSTFDREVLRHFDAYDLRPLLQNVRCPALVIRGQASPVMSFEAARQMSLAVPGGRFVEIPGAAHPVPADNPAAFRRAVFDFLEKETLIAPD